MPELMAIAAVGFGVTGASHVLADVLAPWIEQSAPGLARLSLTSQFFWLVVIATTGGLLLSFTRVRELEGAGASKLASVMLYVLVASIGMGMDIGAVVDRPGLFAVGALWMAIHAGLMLGVGRAIKAPTFYLAVGSQANVGGAASAPVVASAFHPNLAPVGVAAGSARLRRRDLRRLAVWSAYAGRRLAPLTPPTTPANSALLGHGCRCQGHHAAMTTWLTEADLSRPGSNGTHLTTRWRFFTRTVSSPETRSASAR